jgi:hypothetical protein
MARMQLWSRWLVATTVCSSLVSAIYACGPQDRPLGAPQPPVRSSTGILSTDWPNEPAGFTLIGDTDNPFQTPAAWDVTSGSAEHAWDIADNPVQFIGRRLFRLVQAPDAPLNNTSGSYVGEFTYPIGLPAGGDNFPLAVHANNGTSSYFGYWWKANASWQSHPSGVNKISFVLGNNNNFFVQMHNATLGGWGVCPDGSYYVIVTFENTGNISNGHLPNSAGDDPGSRNLFGNCVAVTPGRWYRIEGRYRMSTTNTSRDGIIQWWVSDTPGSSGTVGGNYTTVNFDTADPLLEFRVHPIWGGVESSKTQADTFYFDHVHLSRP